ncbi:MAG: ankyrin-3, partial [Gammaproteobacteria bacterium]|nr:ankyrin-3 [Gammaproteobacteria bacterium]
MIMSNNSSTLNEQLIEAVIEGDFSAVQSLLRRGAEKNAKTANGFTLLHYAADSGHLKIVEKLLEKKAEIEAKDNVGFTPLHCAADSGHPKVVEKLLEKKAEIEAKDNIGFTPLHCAADLGYLDVVEVLLEKKANKEAKANDGFTPLHCAADLGHLDVVETLLKEGADKKAETTSGFTPLHLAAYKGHFDVVETLLNAGANKDAKSKLDKTALDLAEEEGHNEVVALLQKVSVVDNVGHAASAITQNSQAEPLNSMQPISQVQPATKRSRNSEQASEEIEVQPSAKKQKPSSIETTHTSLATAEALPVSTYNYAHSKAELDNCLKNLSEKEQARYCCSLSRKIMFEPVWYQGKHYEREVWLAENPSFAAKGLIDFQLKNQILNCVQKQPKLFKACYTPQYLCQQLEEALAQNELQTLEQLFKMEPLLIHAIDKQKNTWLHKAVKSQKLPLIKSLLAYQASLDKGNSERDRPLHLAVKTGNEDVVKLLLEAHQVQNIAINFPNKEKKKPLDLAEKDSAIANLLEQYQPVKTEFKWVKKLKLYYEKKDASRMVTKIKIPDHQHLKWMSMAEMNQKNAENIVYGSLTFFYKIVNGDEKPIYDFISLKINWPNSFKPDANYLHVAYVYTEGRQELQLAADLGRMHPEHSDEINNIMKNIR